MKTFTIGSAGRKNMSLGAKEYWAEVHDGDRTRPKHYNVTAEDRAIDSANGKKARGVHFTIKKRKK